MSSTYEIKPTELEEINFMPNADNVPILQLRKNGDILVKGKLIENNKEVVNAMREIIEGSRKGWSINNIEERNYFYQGDFSFYEKDYNDAYNSIRIKAFDGEHWGDVILRFNDNYSISEIEDNDGDSIYKRLDSSLTLEHAYGVNNLNKIGNILTQEGQDKLKEILLRFNISGPINDFIKGLERIIIENKVWYNHD
jgi:hypothetical protein